MSNVSAEQAAAAQSIAPVVAVQNFYNLAVRADDALVDQCAEQGIAFVPFFPLGGFRPLQSGALDEVAASLGTSRMQVALAWPLQRSPTILLIPGTSSVAHLRENAGAASVELPPRLSRPSTRSALPTGSRPGSSVDHQRPGRAGAACATQR